MPSDLATEPPTPRRLRRARREGDHPISRALVGLGALGGFALAAPSALTTLAQRSREALAAALQSQAPPAAEELALRVGWLVAPLLGSMALGALAAGMLQTGGALSSRAFAWNLARLDPFARSGRRPAERALSLAIGLCAGAVLCAAGWRVLRAAASGLPASIGDAHAALELSAVLCQALASWALGVALLAGAADGVLSHSAWQNRHRMTRDELQQERREHEGDPELRQARQRTHRELASGGGPAELARASLLLLGSPELAVALRYEAGRDTAPRVVASGQGQLALALEALAVSMGVPVEHDTALVRALISLPLDQAIPRQHFADVARVLAHAGIMRSADPG